MKNWKIASYILAILLILLVSYFIFFYLSSYKSVESWKSAYYSKIDLLGICTTNLENSDSELTTCKGALDKTKANLNDKNTELITQKRIVSQVNCKLSYPSLNFYNSDFTYSGNTSMHRELKKFVEGLGEEITTSNWNLIWNNVDVAMHKISVKGNIRYYFITSFNDSEFGLKNSVYWLDKSCFIDFPGFE